MNKSLEDKLLEKKRMIEIELEHEEYHIDKKDNVYKNKLINKINKIDGFILGLTYAKLKYTILSNDSDRLEKLETIIKDQSDSLILQTKRIINLENEIKQLKEDNKMFLERLGDCEKFED